LSPKKRVPKDTERKVASDLSALRASAEDSSGLAGVDENLTYILGNALRIRILAALNEVDAAPSDIARAFGCSIFQASKQIQVLVDHDYAVLLRVETEGRPKKIYRATKKVILPMEIIERLPRSILNTVVATVFMTNLNDAQVALLSGTFAEHPESHATWTRFRVTERTWRRCVKLLDQTFEKIRKIAESEEQQRKDGELPDGDHPPLLMSLNMAGFLLPPNSKDILQHEKDYLQHQPEGN
jgi:hypothetical protein